jgi:hypothetical protein
VEQPLPMGLATRHPHSTSVLNPTRPAGMCSKFRINAIAPAYFKRGVPVEHARDRGGGGADRRRPSPHSRRHSLAANPGCWAERAGPRRPTLDTPQRRASPLGDRPAIPLGGPAMRYRQAVQTCTAHPVPLRQRVRLARLTFV